MFDGSCWIDAGSGDIDTATDRTAGIGADADNCVTPETRRRAANETAVVEPSRRLTNLVWQVYFLRNCQLEILRRRCNEEFQVSQHYS